MNVCHIAVFLILDSKPCVEPLVELESYCYEQAVQFDYGHDIDGVYEILAEVEDKDLL